MHCRELKKLIESGNLNLSDSSVRDHLSKCAACARLVQSEQVLGRSFENLREYPDDSVSDLNTIRARIISSSASPAKENTIMAKFRDTFTRHPRLSFSLSVVALFVIFSILVPLPYSATVGYDVVINDNSDQAPVSPAQISKALEAVGLDNFGVNYRITANGTEYRLSGFADKEAALRSALTFASVTGIDAEPVYEPEVKRVSGTLMAQIADKIFIHEINISVSGASEEEIQAEIMQQLAASGINVTDVQTKITEDGTQIEINLEAGN